MGVAFIILMKNLKLVLPLFFISSIAAAYGGTTLEIPGTSLKLEPNGSVSSTYIGVNYINNRSIIDHNETSDSPGFYSLNKRLRTPNNSVNVSLTKEFLKSEAYSVSLTGGVGFGGGEHDFSESGNALSYKEKLSDLNYGAGVSINTNFNTFGFKFQPFISTQYFINQSDYTLGYKDLSNSSDQISIKYDVTNNYLKHTLGIRYFNMSRSVLSTFSVDFNQNLSQTSKVEASKGDLDLVLKSTSEAKTRPVTFSIGFGFML